MSGGGASGSHRDGRPPWLQDRLRWFMGLRFGLFLHWGPYCQWDCCESWPLSPADTWARPDHLRCWTERGRDLARFSRDYRDLNRTFNPTRFDPDAWARLAGDAGFRYVAFTTKHHDGFCMFDTATTDYRVTHRDCPFHGHPRANITAALFEAFRAQRIAISCYFSKSDWHCPWYWSPDAPALDRNPNYDTPSEPERWARFVAFVHRQIEELMTQYGRIDVLWLDGGQVRPPDQDIEMARVASMARSHQPGLIIADRTVGGPYEDLVTPEQEIPDEPLGVPWEACMTLGDSWKYVPGDRYKSPRAVIDMLVEIAAKGGNLLLGVGPDPEGMMPSSAETCLREVGAWLKTNGEAIYGTSPVAPYRTENVCFTSRGPWTYAIEGGERWRGERVSIEGIRPRRGSALSVLGSPEPVAWEPVDRGFCVDLPEVHGADAHGRVVRFVAT